MKDTREDKISEAHMHKVDIGNVKKYGTICGTAPHLRISKLKFVWIYISSASGVIIF